MTRLVLLAGAGEDRDTWAEVLPLLPATTVCHDLPGHDQRGGAPLGDIEAMGRDVAAALDGRAVLVGHSMGGAVALACALAAPERVAGLVLVTTGARLPVNPAFFALLPERLDEAMPLLLSGITGGRRGAIPAGKEAVAARMEAMIRRTGGALFAADLRACAAYDVNERLGEVSAPAVVLAGDVDRMTPPPLATALAEGLCGKLIVLPGVGHQLAWEAPHAVASACADLLAGGPWSGSGMARGAGPGWPVERVRDGPWSGSGMARGAGPGWPWSGPGWPWSGSGMPASFELG